MEVDKLTKFYGVNHFIVTDGASKISNNGNEAANIYDLYEKPFGELEDA